MVLRPAYAPALPASPACRAQEAPPAAWRRDPGGGRHKSLCPGSSSESWDRQVSSAGPAAWGRWMKTELTKSRRPLCRACAMRSCWALCWTEALSSGPGTPAQGPRAGRVPQGTGVSGCCPACSSGTHSLFLWVMGCGGECWGTCSGESCIQTQLDPSLSQEKRPLCGGVRPGAGDALPSQGLHHAGASLERQAWGLRALNPGHACHLESHGNTSRWLGVRSNAMGHARKSITEPWAGPSWPHSHPLRL